MTNAAARYSSKVFHLSSSLSLLLAICFLVLSKQLFAAEKWQGNKVNFSITESQNVANDSISITFTRVAEGTSAQTVANEINQQMQAAIRALKTYPDILTETTQYNIHPVYKKSVISHWRGSQNLILTLENKPGLVKILAKIQPYLAYQSMQFGVSTELKKEIMAKLTDRAIHSFRTRANRIAQGFMAPSYKIIETNINTPNYQKPRPYMARTEMAMASADMVSPTVKAGESMLKVTISGSILLPN
jgi:predicted secreted protein